MGHTEGQAAEKRVTSLARAVVYRFLALCFSYPDMELLKLFDGDSLGECLDAWHVLGLDASGEMREVIAWLESTGPEVALSELQVEYTRLFVNAYPRIPAPPYSSVYLDEDRLVWGPSTAQAGRFYEEAGLCPSADFADIPDHIAAEMEFVSYLILEQHKTDQEGVTTSPDMATIENQFLADHFLKWAPLFLDRVVGNTGAIFYGGVARLALEFTKFEARRMINA
ncbi:MAG: molecular chaperone TorD family protein [Dehalococcoidia bacterium]